MNTIQSYTPSFQARCPQICEAQRVCHIINSGYAHASTTRIKPALYNLMAKDNVSDAFKNKYYVWLRRFSEQMQEVRDTFQGSVKGIMTSKLRPMKIFQQLKLYHMGNCNENAVAAEAILKLNGVPNACCATLKKGNASIDHMVCVFNRDGSKFDGKIKNNQTIIVDPWLGKADFANNMFKYYENNCKTLLNFKNDEKFAFGQIIESEISDFDKTMMKQFYPDLFYKK
jgi:hypothetical protein